MRNIERKVDHLIGLKAGGENVKREKRHDSFIKQWGKRITPMVAVGVVMSVVTAAMLSYFVFINVDINVDPLLTFDDIPAENLDISETVNGIPGNTQEYNHWLNLSADADSTRTVLFNWAGDVTEINCSVIYEGSIITLLDLEPGHNYEIKTHYQIRTNAKSGSYNVNLTIVEHTFGY